MFCLLTVHVQNQEAMAWPWNYPNAQPFRPCNSFNSRMHRPYSHFRGQTSHSYGYWNAQMYPSFGNVDAQLYPNNWRYSKAELDQYFTDKVDPNRAETQRVIDALMPDLDTLFECIKAEDWRLCKEVVKIGSYYQGLKIQRSDEFDYSVCLNVSIPNLQFGDYLAFYGFTEPREHPGYDWHAAHTMPQEMPNGRLSFLHYSMDKHLNIERKRRPLDSPGTGYHIVRF